MAENTERIRGEIEETQTRMGDTIDALTYKTDVKARTKEAVADKKNKVVGKVTGVKDSIVGTANRAKNSVSAATDTAQDAMPDGGAVAGQVKEGTRQAASVAQENPLGLAIGAAAIGFLAGMFIPSTRLEDERIGEVSDRVKEQAAGTAREAVDRGKQVAQEAVGSAAEKVKAAGKEQAHELASSAQSRAQETGSQLRS